MKVAIDARRLQDEPRTGVGRRLANLLPHLAREVDLVLLTDRRRPATGLHEYEVVALPCPPGLPEPFWLQVSVARWLRSFDGIFDGTYNAIPFAPRCPTVVTIHDLAWLHHPEDLPRSKQVSFRAQARWAARRAGSVLTVSDYIRAALVEAYHLPADRVLVSPNAVDAVFSPDRADDLPALRRRLGIGGPYIVALGGAARRGLEVALEAWHRLPTPRPALVVVGPAPGPVDPGIVQAGRLTDPMWATLLAGAMAFCYPTRYEGFGLPALEAAAAGTPVVCARLGPLPEVLGDAAQWCPSPAVADIAAGLAWVVADEELRDTLRQAGLARAAAAPTWAESAAVVLTAYRRAAA
jgi:glycosyltransferase involved in cell wall biosynthesis